MVAMKTCKVGKTITRVKEEAQKFIQRKNEKYATYINAVLHVSIK
jgi:hypothetical protein